MFISNFSPSLFQPFFCLIIHHSIMDFNIEKPSKRRNYNLQQEDEQEDKFRILPEEIAIDIFSRLPITSAVQSRFVCRSWQTLSLDQTLISLHSSQVWKQNPLLIFHCDYPIRNQLWFAEFSGTADIGKGVVRKLSTPFSDSMSEFSIIGSCNGLLCLSDSLFNDAMYIYNPFTRDYKVLPKSRQYEEEVVVGGFGYHPGTKEYKVVKIIYYWNVNFEDRPRRRIRTPRNSKSEVLVLTLGGNNNRWRSLGNVPYYLQRRPMEGLHINGRLHWLTQGVYNNARGLIIVSFDLADEKFHEIPRPDFSSVADGRTYNLAILKGCLSAVVYRFSLQKDMEIWIMKEYNVKESWIKEFKIGSFAPEPFKMRPIRIWRNSFNRACVRVLGILQNGVILVEYKGGKLSLHDPENGTYKDISFQGLPSLFQTVVFQGSLNWIDLSRDM